MHYLKTAAVSGMLTISMAASLLAGCGKHINGTAPAVVINGEELNVGTANFILRYQQAETVQLMQMYGLTDGSTLWDTDISGDDEEAESTSESAASESAASESAASESASSESAADSSSASDSSAASSASEEEEKHFNTYGEQYKDSVLNNIERMVVMRQHMSDYGLSLTDEQQAKIDEVAADLYEANKDILGGLGTTEADINQVVELVSYEYIMHDAILEGADIEVTDEEAAQKTLTYARFATTVTDEESGEDRDMTDEELAEVEKKANELLDKVKAEDNVAGADISAMAKEIDDSVTTMQTSFGSDDTIFPDAVKDALAGLKDGELYDGTIKTDDGFIYVVRLDKEFDEEMTESKKKSLLNTKEQDYINEQVQSWLDAAEIEVKDGWNALEVTDSKPYVVKAEAAEEDAGTDASSESAVEAETETTSESAVEAEADTEATSKSAAGADAESTSKSAAGADAAASSSSSAE